MSSASSGRYQSRLFNFAHRQSRRFTQQCDRTLRQLQFTTSGVVTALLSPLYLLFQSNRSITKQLHKTVQQISRLPGHNTDYQSHPPDVDTPIERVMLVVDALSSEEAVSTPFPKSESPSFLTFLLSNTLTRFNLNYKNTSKGRRQESKIEVWHGAAVQLKTQNSPIVQSALLRNRPVIRAIATLIENRTLVIITEQNQILDILTAQQQQKLQERIIAEVANYWRYQRLTHSIEGQSTTGLPVLFKSQEKRDRGQPCALHPVTPHPLLAFLDRTVAQVESNQLASVSEVAIALSNHSWGIVQQLQTICSLSLSRTKLPRVDNDQPQRVYAPDTPNQPFTIQTLIWAAIDYFFGDRGGKLEHTPSADFSKDAAPQSPDLLFTLQPTDSKPKTQTKRLSRRQLVSDNTPWLTLNDLFGDSVVAGTANLHQPLSQSQTINAATRKKNLIPSIQSPKYFLRKLFKFQFLPQPQPQSVSVKQTIKSKALRKQSSKQLPSLVSSSQDSLVSTSQPINQNSQMKPAPDWIETNATVMGYVKHPLEQLLAWIDRAMLWLEEVLLKIWGWLKQCFEF